MPRGQTPSQTIGPYFAYALTPEQYGYRFASIASAVVAGEEVEGERIIISGQVLDGEGVPVDDAMLEIWQPDANGQYAGQDWTAGRNVAFRGFGRAGTGTDPDHRFRFETIKPGSPEDGVAPHISVVVFMRGLLNHLYTRIYFSDEEAVNAGDPVLSALPEDRRNTLIAKRHDGPNGAHYRFDIRMQGKRETVFFDV